MSTQQDLQSRAAMQDMTARLEQVKQSSEQLTKVVGSAHTPDRSVLATVNVGGVLTNLTLTPEALDLGPQRLVSTIMETVGRAQQDASARGKDIVAELREVGVDAPALMQGRLPERTAHNIDAELAALKERAGAGRSEEV